MFVTFVENLRSRDFEYSKLQMYGTVMLKNIYYYQSSSDSRGARQYRADPEQVSGKTAIYHQDSSN